MGMTTEELLALPGKNTATSVSKGMTTEELLSLPGQGSTTGQGSPASKESGVSDFLKSTGSGLASGVLGLADLGSKLDPSSAVMNLASAASKAIDGDYSGSKKTILDNLTSSPFTDAADQLTGGVTKYQPQTTAGKYSKTVAEFAPGMIGGEAGLIPKAIKIAGDVIVPGVASEAAGQYAESHNLDPRVQTAMRIAGGLLGSVPSVAISSISGKAKAASELAAAASDPKAAAVKIGDAQLSAQLAPGPVKPRPGENIPGSVPDTAELTGDVGLAHLRKKMLMEEDFNKITGENQAAQNSARQRVMDAVVPDADTMKLSNDLNVKKANAEHAASIAESEASAKASAIPSAQIPEDSGSIFRNKLDVAKAASKAKVDAAFAKVDPGNKVVMVTAPIKAAVKEAMSGYTPGLSAPLGAGEARIVNAVKGVGETTSFSGLKALRENVNSAIDDSLGEFGRATQETGRLQIIKKGIDDAINNAQMHQSNYAPSAGYSGPVPNVDPKTAADLAKANSLYGQHIDNFVSGPVGQALQKSGNDFKNSSASVYNKSFPSGNDPKVADSFLGATPDSLQHLKEIAISKFQDFAGEKPITQKMLDDFRTKYSGSLRSVEAKDPKFMNTITEAAKSGSKASDLRKDAKAMQVIGAHGPDDMRNAVGKALSDGGTSVKSLITSAAGDADAIAGIKRAGLDHMIEKFSNAGSLGGEKILSGSKLGKYVDQNSDAIRELLGDDGLNSLKTISSDIERSQVAIENARTRTGGSDTAYMLGKEVKDIQGRIGSGIKSLSNTAAGVGVGYTHPIIGVGLSFAHGLGSIIERLGAAKTKTMIKEALLNPIKAKEMLDYSRNGGKIPTWLMPLILSVGSASNRTQYASGGSVGINYELEAEKLIEMAEQSKSRHGKTTEPLLNQSDEHIVKALGIAGEAI